MKLVTIDLTEVRSYYLRFVRCKRRRRRISCC